MRLGAAILLVLLTWNPSGTSYYHWVSELEDSRPAVKALLGLLLLGGYVIYFRATSRSLGAVGSAIVLGIFGLLLWVMIDAGIIPQDSAVLQWIGLLVLGTFLAVGMTGSYVWRRMTGQYHVSGDEEAVEE